MSGTTNVPEVTVLIRKDKKILFVLRQNTGYADGTYAMPGGHVDPDEKLYRRRCPRNVRRGRCYG